MTATGRRSRRRGGAGPIVAVFATLSVVCGLLAPRAIAQGSAATDRAALEALYHATGGPNWTNRTNWLSDAPLDQWLGVRTNDRGRVAGLDLDDPNGGVVSGGGNNLTGAIPPELGALSELEVLYLNHNALRGPIPAELGSLDKLRLLWLYDNKLSGPIPTEEELSNVVDRPLT